MKWKKLGRVFSPSGQFPWMKSHAQAPVALHREGDIYRVFFGSRDELNRTHIAYVDIDLKEPQKILAISTAPVLAPGSLGNFDDHGVYAASILRHDGKLWMYTIGWNPGPRPPLFYSSIGLAQSLDNGVTFQRVSSAPIMARGIHDPCLVTAPFVMVDGGVFRMWYVSGFKWEEVDSLLQSYYHIKYAESVDGKDFKRDGLVCIPLQGIERNIARPSVLKSDGIYKMWYSRSDDSGYRIGYAESQEGLTWHRKDSDSGIDVSPTGWDAKAQAYPCVFTHGDRFYMLYNGNNFGREGFGLAISEDV